jgi:hypothetical protein
MATRQCSNEGPSRVLNQFSALTKFSILALGLFALSGMAAAQSKLMPGIDVFGGYSHLTVPTNSLGFGSRTEMNGFNVSLSIPHIFQGLGVTVDGSGHYATALEQYNYALGPQYKWEFSRFRVIAHILYGRSQTRVLDVGSTFSGPSDRQRTLIFGGEIDIPITSRFWFRAVQPDYVRTSAFGNSLGSLRLSTGLVYSFGKH